MLRVPDALCEYRPNSKLLNVQSTGYAELEYLGTQYCRRQKANQTVTSSETAYCGLIKH